MNPNKKRTRHLPLSNHKALGLGTVAVLSSLTLTSLTDKAQAAIVITGQEIGGNVVFSYTGSLNTTGLGTPVSDNFTNGISPSGSVIVAGQGIETNRRYENLIISGPSSFGTGGINDSATGSGDIFGFGLTIAVNPPAIQLPQDYVSGTGISGTLTFDSATFASLGVNNSQSYTWTLDANSDTITLQFVSQSVPEGDNVAGLALLGMGAAGIRVWRKRKQLKLEQDKTA